jgi:3-hydroxyacyl-CoA dehydrogenase
VFEDMQLKRQIFSDLDRVCRADAILATNTSTLDIDFIAAATSRPNRVVGHHFFAPAHVMRLLEIVRGRETSAEVIASSLAIAKRLDKVAVVVGNCRGFVGNRMYHQYQREAQFLLEEGASVEQVDLALYNFGMAMGPFAAADLSGLDVGWRIRKEHADSESVGARRSPVGDRLCEMGRFGQKTGAGWYRYEQGDRRPIPDPEIDRLVQDCARAAGITRRAIAPDVIVERTIYALVNEGAKILEEGIALRPIDIDMVYVYGYGFPAHRGGPMWHADTVGLAAVHERVAGYYREFGDYWMPAPLLKRLAESETRFYDLERPAGAASKS